MEETWGILQSYSALEAFDEAAQAGLVLWMGDNIKQTLSNLQARFEG